MNIRIRQALESFRTRGRIPGLYLGLAIAVAISLQPVFPAHAAQSPPGRRTPASFDILFEGDAVLVTGLRPGTQTAWFGILRERIDHHTRVSRHRSIVVAGAEGIAAVQATGLEHVRSAWGVVNLDSGEFATFTSPGYDAWLSDAPPITITADELIVSFGYVEALHVRPGDGAWTFAAVDGSDADGDDSANSRVVLSPDRSKALRGNARPPTRFETGDVLILIDRLRMRVYASRVELP